MSKSAIDKFIEKLLDKDTLTPEEVEILLLYLRPKPKTILEQIIEVVNFINGGTK